MQKKTLWKESIFSLVLIGALLPQIFALLARSSWVFELFSHYFIYYLFLDIALVLFYLFFKRKKSVLTLLVFLSFSLAMIWPSWVSPPFVQAQGPILTIMSYNFFILNEEFDAFYDQVMEVQPDILVIHEAGEAWITELPRYLELYPYQGYTENWGVSGMIILSQYPATFEEVYFTNVPSLTALVTVENRTLRVIGFHPLPPVTSEKYLKWDESFKNLEDYLLSLDQRSAPTLVVGDFNCTPWSPHFRDLIGNTSWRSAQQGYGLDSTWNQGIWWLKIPIDHILVPSDVSVMKFSILQEGYSDHLPVLAELQIP